MSISRSHSTNSFCVATALLVVGSTQLVAQQPTGEPGVQASEAEPAPREPSVNSAQSEGDQIVYGLTVENRDDGAPLVLDVRPATPPWEAGLRPGDRLVAYGDCRDVAYARFIEWVNEINDETFSGDSIAVVYHRGDQSFETEFEGIGRRPEDLRALQERSERAIAEKLEPEQDASRDAPVSTPMLTEYLRLSQLASSGDGGSMSAADRARYNELGATLYGGTVAGGAVLGGNLYDPGLVPAGSATGASIPGWRQTRKAGDQPQRKFGTGIGENQNSSQGLGAASNAGTPGTDIGDAAGTPRANASPRQLPSALRNELSSLQQLRQGGSQMTLDQSRRLAALEQISNMNYQAPRGSSRALTQPMQAELSQLQQAVASGQATPAQRQRIAQINQMRNTAISRNGANRNLPATNPASPASGGATNAAGGVGAAGASGAVGASGGSGAAQANAGSGIGEAGN